MDPDKIKEQNLKVIISEAIMVLAVIVTVIILALLVSGYWLNADFEVERNGMLQISSVPTGASVELDGKTPSWTDRTNLSKILTSGEHTVTLTKDGYDSWSKTISITEGLLYRLHYPRLFPKDRTAESVLNTPDYTKASISSDHSSLLLVNNTTKWSYVNLDADKLSPREVDISPIFSSVSLAEGAEVGLFIGEIVSLDWDLDAEHVLIKAKHDDNTEWVLLDLERLDHSINLTKEFGADFSRIAILDHNSNHLLAVRNGNLHQIDIPSRSISAILIDIIDFDHFENEVVFSAMRSEAPQPEAAAKYYTGIFKIGDDRINELEDTTVPVKVAIGKFYDSKYIVIVADQQISVHQKDTFASDIAEYELSFMPDLVKVGHDGEFLLTSNGTQLATLDFEANQLHEWSIDSDQYGWLDNDMLYAISEGDLIVYDYDGLNRRIIADDASTLFPASVTKNKWLYYFSDDRLVREVLN